MMMNLFSQHRKKFDRKKMTNKLQEVGRQLCPPVLWRGLRSLANLSKRGGFVARDAFNSEGKQDLDVYWDPKMSTLLETWGEGTVWNEIQLLLADRRGRVLDIACGTGKTMEVISRFPLEAHGCDISDLLIGKAVERGIAKDRLTVCDATKLPYPKDSFDYAYSIGSLEHFTEDGIAQFLSECHRVVRRVSFHMIPVARSGKSEGWIKTYQSYHNNSVAWWLEKYKSAYQTVYVLDSTWGDEISVGKWFVCVKEGAD